jgi:two-component system, response regulator
LSTRKSLILLVEAESRSAAEIIQTLQATDSEIHIEWVQDSRAALDFLFRTGKYADDPHDSMPDLVLLNLCLPDMEGIEVLRIIKSYMRLRLIPIVMLVEAPDSAMIGGLYQLGVNGCLIKALEPDLFRQSLQHAASYWLTVNHAWALDIAPERLERLVRETQEHEHLETDEA